MKKEGEPVTSRLEHLHQRVIPTSSCIVLASLVLLDVERIVRGVENDQNGRKKGREDRRRHHRWLGGDGVGWHLVIVVGCVRCVRWGLMPVVVVVTVVKLLVNERGKGGSHGVVSIQLTFGSPAPPLTSVIPNHLRL
jgi:hypothetical protein